MKPVLLSPKMRELSREQKIKLLAALLVRNNPDATRADLKKMVGAMKTRPKRN